MPYNIYTLFYVLKRKTSTISLNKITEIFADQTETLEKE